MFTATLKKIEIFKKKEFIVKKLIAKSQVEKISEFNNDSQ